MRIRFYERGFDREGRFFAGKNFDFERERAGQVSQSSRENRRGCRRGRGRDGCRYRKESLETVPVQSRGGPRSGQIYATHMRQAV